MAKSTTRTARANRNNVKNTNANVELSTLAVNVDSHIEPIREESPMPLPQTILPQLVLDDPANILNSKRYIKGGAQFMSPLELLEPCINALHLSGGRLTLSGSHESENANQDGTENKAYGRLNLVSRYEIDNDMYYEVGVLIALDLQIPRVKVYRGAKVAACLNLCIFSAEDTVKFDISEGVNMETVRVFLTNLNDKIQESIRIANRLKAIPIEESQVNTIVGAMLMQTIEKDTMNGTQPVMKAAQLFADEHSKYFYKQPDFNAWQLFNGFTEYFDKKINFFDIPEKTRDTYQLLKGICGFDSVEVQQAAQIGNN